MLARRSSPGSLFRAPAARVPPCAKALLSDEALRSACRAFVSRRVPAAALKTLIGSPAAVVAGDLLLVRVLHPGRRQSLETAAGTMVTVKQGDLVVACFAGVRSPEDTPTTNSARYRLDPSGVLREGDAHDAAVVTAELVGALGDARGRTVNISDWAVAPGHGAPLRPVIAIIGEPSVPGEPCRVVDIVRGLVGAGFSVGAVSLTRAQGCWKTRLLRHAGASAVADTIDAGFVDTRGGGTGIHERVFVGLTSRLAAEGVDVVVTEIERGAYGYDTAAILGLPSFRSRIRTIVLEARGRSISELERDSLRTLGYDVTLIGASDWRGRYRPID